MKVINLFGSPGTGKSTTAAGLFHLMKLKGYSVELVTEYAKDLTWAQHHKKLEEQIIIFAEQNHRLNRLKGKIDYVITDSPLLLSHIYTPVNYFPSFRMLVDEVFQSYNNLNFFLERVKPYVTIGRNQTEKESDSIAAHIHDLLDGEYYFISLPADENAPKEILDTIPEIMKGK